MRGILEAGEAVWKGALQCISEVVSLNMTQLCHAFYHGQVVIGPSGHLRLARNDCYEDW